MTIIRSGIKEAAGIIKENMEKELQSVWRHKRSRRVFFLVLMTALLSTGGILLPPLSGDKDYGTNAVKTIDSVKIEEGDSLWSIASRYYSKDCKNMHRYIREIKITNHLSGDTLHTGNYLLVPYYVQADY